MVVDKSDSVIDGLRRENNVLQDQIQDLMEQVKTKADMDDEIMVKVNDKVEQWKVRENIALSELMPGVGS